MCISPVSLYVPSPRRALAIYYQVQYCAGQYIYRLTAHDKSPYSYDTSSLSRFDKHGISSLKQEAMRPRLISDLRNQEPKRSRCLKINQPNLSVGFLASFPIHHQASRYNIGIWMMHLPTHTYGRCGFTTFVQQQLTAIMMPLLLAGPSCFSSISIGRHHA